MDNQINLIVEGKITDSTANLLGTQSFSAKGLWGYGRSDSKVELCKNGINPAKLTGTKFYQICNEIRSSKFNEINKVLKENSITTFTIGSETKEQELIKALCNIFVWLEYFFVDSDLGPNTSKLVNNNEFLPKMYNEFITDDYYENDGALNDIYLLPQPFGSKEASQLEKLWELQFLYKVSLTIRNETFKNYFLPFLKPKDYKTQLLPYPALLKVFNQIIVDRNNCLSNFYKNR